jgi:hypothetical protein
MALITQASAGVVPGFKEVAGVSHPGGADKSSLVQSRCATCNRGAVPRRGSGSGAVEPQAAF